MWPCQKLNLWPSGVWHSASINCVPRFIYRHTGKEDFTTDPSSFPTASRVLSGFQAMSDALWPRSGICSMSFSIRGSKK
jgi:hypothetical protein